MNIYEINYIGVVFTMKCACGNETRKALMKVGCLAFDGYICDKCGRGWHNEGLEAFGWEDLTKFRNGANLGNFSPRDFKIDEEE